MTSFFGSIRNYLFKGKDKSGQPSRITKYEDEIKLILDTVSLANPSVLAGGFPLYGPSQSVMPTLSEAKRCGKISIKSLCELMIGMTYVTEKGTIVLRVSVDDVVLGGGKIQLPILVDDWVNSKHISQYCMRGSLHPDTLVIAVENFTQKRVRDGLLLYEQTKKSGRLIFDFAQLQTGIVYATPEDHIMLERANEPPYINFTFGRNLYWYQKSKKDGSSSDNKENSLNEADENDLLSPSSASKRKARKNTPSKINQTKSNDMEMNGGIPMPPPPPPGMIRALQFDANGVPVCATPPPPGGKKRRKVRQLHWNKIPQNQLSGTIWKEKGSPSRLPIDIDQKELEDMFSLSPMKDANGNPVVFNLNGSSSSKSASRPTLLDLKRSNNGAVLLSQFKMDYDEIRNALISMNHENQLSIENLIALKYLFPLTDQERRDLLEYKGDVKLCGPAEQFYLKTLDVPRPDVRIRMLIFKYQYQEVSDTIDAGTLILNQGSSELVASDKFAKVLQLILKFGRALNGAQAAGFRLDSLSKLVDTKAKDKKTSMLDYLISVVVKQLPELIEFWNELPYLDHVSKLATETMVEGLKEIKETLDALKLELELVSVNMTPDQEATVAKISSELQAKASETQSLSNWPSSDMIESKTAVQDSSDEVITTTIDTKVPETVVPMNAGDADCYFKAHMVSFYESHLSLYQATKKRHEAAVNAFEKAVRYFGEDPKTTQPTSFFNILVSFVENWKQSRAKLERMQAAKLKAEAKQAKLAEQLQKSQEEKLENQVVEESANNCQPEMVQVEIVDEVSISSQQEVRVEIHSTSTTETVNEEIIVCSESCTVIQVSSEDAPVTSPEEDKINSVIDALSSLEEALEASHVESAVSMPFSTEFQVASSESQTICIESKIEDVIESSSESTETKSLIFGEWTAEDASFGTAFETSTIITETNQLEEWSDFVSSRSNSLERFNVLPAIETSQHPLAITESSTAYLEF